MVEMQRLQESGYHTDRDYREGSPHLSHWWLYDRLSTLLRETLRDVSRAGLPPTVLEVGAGHGGFTEPALAAGAEVVATEMSRPSVAHLRERYASNPRFGAVFDPTGDLAALGDQRFSLVVCSSVLHHIPDYLAFLDGPVLDRLRPGGSFLSFQDPLWYPSVGPLVRRLDRWSYLAWRVGRGNYRQGFATFFRRLQGCYDEANPADMVEYHVVRQGVNHHAVEDLLTPRFTSLALNAYWSTASSVLQRAGERLGRPNTFLVRAEGYRGAEADSGEASG